MIEGSVNDLPEPTEDAPPPAPRKTSGLAWAFVFLVFVILTVELLSIEMLGTNANNTFSKIGPVPAPPPRPVPSHK